MEATYDSSSPADSFAIHLAQSLQNISNLCDLCRTIPFRARRNDRVFFEFHNMQALAASAARGCHFCWLIEDEHKNMQVRPEADLNSPDIELSFLAELRWWYDFRIDLLLFHVVYSQPMSFGLGFRDEERKFGMLDEVRICSK